jgi:metal transporter CNNM
MNIIVLGTLLVLLVFSAIFSGMSLGLYSLDKTDLERKAELGNKRASRVLRVRKRGNLLLVSILLGNVAVNSAISIILGNVSSGVVAGATATGLIVVFGEIIPQATCARYALAVGSRMAWFIELTMFIFYPIAKPIAWSLDKALGKEMKTVWSKRELEHIISMHEEHPHSVIDRDEERIILGALRFSDKTANEVMTSVHSLFALPAHEVVGDKVIKKIRAQGYTRVPIYQGNINNVVGLLLVKDLVGIDDGVRLDEVMRTDRIVRIAPSRKLDVVLNLMIYKHAHMAILTEEDGVLVGIVTLEDIIEEILGREIQDEHDEVSA